MSASTSRLQVPKAETAVEAKTTAPPAHARTTFPGPAAVRLSGTTDNASTIQHAPPRLPSLPPLRPRASVVPSPPRPASLPTFTVTSFDTPPVSGNPTLTQTAAGLTIDSPLFRSSATVQANGDPRALAGWRIGYVQTISTF